MNNIAHRCRVPSSRFPHRAVDLCNQSSSLSDCRDVCDAVGIVVKIIPIRAALIADFLQQAVRVPIVIGNRLIVLHDRIELILRVVSVSRHATARVRQGFQIVRRVVCVSDRARVISRFARQAVAAVERSGNGARAARFFNAPEIIFRIVSIPKIAPIRAAAVNSRRQSVECTDSIFNFIFLRV